MAKDELDRWLGLRGSKPRPVATKTSYQAFKPVERRQIRVHICPRLQQWEWLPYFTLQRIVTDADYGTSLALIWGYAVVIIRGRNLQAIDASLATEHCEELREFDPDRYARPDDTDAFIDSIKIHTESREAMAKAEAEATADKRH
jgi:hypothetical protein